MDLQRVGKHDKNDDCSATNGAGHSRRVHGSNISSDVVAKGEVASDSYEDVDNSSRAD